MAARLTPPAPPVHRDRRRLLGLAAIRYPAHLRVHCYLARRRSAAAAGERMSAMWIAPQFLVFGVSEMFTAVGLIEFFYNYEQAAAGMQASMTALTYCSYAFGFYLSSALVLLVNKATAGYTGPGGWLSDNGLNKDRLNLFYWMLAALSAINFCFYSYLLCARWYSSVADVAESDSAQVAA